MNALYSAAQCREIDRLAMQQLQLEGLQLMQRAADSALSMLAQYWPEAQHLSVYCGPGNNGGDGYLLAVKAHQLGYKVQLWVVLPPASELAKATYSIAREQGLVILSGADHAAGEGDARTDVVVDAIFGHGLTRPVEGGVAERIECLNQSGKPILALDIPSGINSDTGAVMGVAIDATASCSFIVPKLGMFTAAGVDHSGVIEQISLGVPSSVYAAMAPACEVITASVLRNLLPVPPASSHKGNFGHVAIVGGQTGMVGAAILAALGAARSGSGRVTVLSSIDHIHLIQNANPVLMSWGIEVDARVDLPDSVTAVALGPGLGSRSAGDADQHQSNWSESVFEACLRQTESKRLPLLLDADALTLLAASPRKNSHWVLTPHPKEAATLLDTSVAEIQANRPAACSRIAQQYGGICVLKGKGSLISDGGQRQAICIDGNWGMATAGSGDVLSGIITAFLAMGMDAYDAARLGVGVHARAGDAAANGLARRSMLATDIIASLASVFRKLEGV